MNRLLAGLMLWASLPAVAIGLFVAAPEPTQPEPTAFLPGLENLDAWRQDLIAQGHDVRSIVSEAFLAIDAPHPKSTLLVVPQPIEPPTRDIQEVWQHHLDQGGAILIIDGVGTTNRFLALHGAAVANTTIINPDPEIKAIPSRPPGGTDHALSLSPSALVLEEATGWVVLLETRSDSFLDIDGNQQVDRHDTPGPHLIGAKRQVGSGTLAVMTSTSLLADRFVGDPSFGNQAVMADIVASLLPERGTVLIDESHHGWASPEHALIPVVRSASAISGSLLWTGTLLAGLAMLATFLILRAPRVSPYKPHALAKTTVQAQDLPADDGFFRAVASQLQSRQTGRRSAINEEQNPGGDPLISRALRGDVEAEDIDKLMRRYQTEVNHHA